MPNNTNGVSDIIANDGANDLEKDSSFEPLNKVFSGAENIRSKCTVVRDEMESQFNGDIEKDDRQSKNKNKLKFAPNSNRLSSNMVMFAMEDQKRKKKCKQQQEQNEKPLSLNVSAPMENANDNSTMSGLMNNNKVNIYDNSIVDKTLHATIEYKNKSCEGMKRAKMPTPPPSKNVSFNAFIDDEELCYDKEKIHTKQKIMFPASSIQMSSKHQYLTTGKWKIQFKVVFYLVFRHILQKHVRVNSLIEKLCIRISIILIASIADYY